MRGGSLSEGIDSHSLNKHFKVESADKATALGIYWHCHGPYSGQQLDYCIPREARLIRAVQTLKLPAVSREKHQTHLRFRTPRFCEDRVVRLPLASMCSTPLFPTLCCGHNGATPAKWPGSRWAGPAQSPPAVSRCPAPPSPPAPCPAPPAPSHPGRQIVRRHTRGWSDRDRAPLGAGVPRIVFARSRRSAGAARIVFARSRRSARVPQ
eukprot:1194451-Prorocentrum_minimum.AAC.1